MKIDKQSYMNGISKEDLIILRDKLIEESEKPSPEELERMTKQLEKALDGREILLRRPLTDEQIHQAALNYLMNNGWEHLFINGKHNGNHLPSLAQREYDCFVDGILFATK